MDVTPPPLIGTKMTRDLLSLMEPKSPSMADSDDLPFLKLWDERGEPQPQLLDSVTANMTVASASSAVSIHDPQWDNSYAVMGESSSWLSLGRNSAALSPSTPVFEEDMPSTSSGKGPSSSPEVLTADLNVHSIKRKTSVDVDVLLDKKTLDLPSIQGEAEYKRKLSIVMVLIDEDLHVFLQKRPDANTHSPPFTVFEAVNMILQIGEGANYLHENDIVHRDLKSFNICVKNVLPTDPEVQYVLIKVADTGFSKATESSIRYFNQSSYMGWNRRMPPEITNSRINDGQLSIATLQAGPKYPKKSDVYKFVKFNYEISTGDLAFPHEPSLVNIKEKVLMGERPLSPDCYSSILRGLIEACWDPQSTNRSSFASKHLRSLLTRDFNSIADIHDKSDEPFTMSLGITPFEAPTREINEDSHVVMGEPLQMSPKNTPFDAPIREMVVQKSPDARKPLPLSPEITPFKAPTKEIVVWRSPDVGKPITPMSSENTPIIAPTREMVVQSRADVGKPLSVSPENTPFEAPTSELVVQRSPITSEPLQMSLESTPCEAPTRELAVRNWAIRGLIMRLLTVWRRPLRVFISHAGGPDGAGKSFPSWLYQSLKNHRWSSCKFHVKPFLDVADCPKGLPFATKIRKELARFDVGIVVVTPAFFKKHWPMTELVKFVEVLKQDRDGRIRVLPLFYELTPGQLRQGLDDGRWEQCWVKFSASNHPLELQECRDAVSRLCQLTGVRYGYEKRDHDIVYIDTILRVVDQILREERSFVADLRWVLSLCQRN